LDSKSLAESAAAHAIGCTCWPCQKERKRLRDEAEADRRADLEAALPPVKEETRALFEMIGRNGDTADSTRELIAVPPKIHASLLEYARHRPRAKQGILKVLDLRQRVAAEFERLARFKMTRQAR
jgi:hypothetical protein